MQYMSSITPRGCKTGLYERRWTPIMQGMSTYIYEQHPRERGSVIWFILLAIALTAALTMTLTRSSDTGGQTGDIERARVQASEIMRYAKGIETAVDQMIMRGVGESQLSFENSFVSGYHTNANCTDDACKVFGNGGGGQTYMTPRDEWLDLNQDAQPLYGEWYFAGTTCVEDVGTGAAGCSADSDYSNEDLVIYLPWLSQEVCSQLNILLGLPGTPAIEAGILWDTGNPMFNGVYTDGAEINRTAQESGCIAGSGGAQPAGSYHFYHVLIDR